MYVAETIVCLYCCTHSHTQNAFVFLAHYVVVWSVLCMFVVCVCVASAFSSISDQRSSSVAPIWYWMTSERPTLVDILNGCV